MLDLLRDLNVLHDRTVVLVLHHLNLAARYAHHLVAMRDGAIVAQGPPADVVCAVIDDPLTGTPVVLPRPTAAPVRPSS